MANEGPGRGMDITRGCCMMLVWFSGERQTLVRGSVSAGDTCPGSGMSPAPHILFGDLPGPPASQPQPPPLPPCPPVVGSSPRNPFPSSPFSQLLHLTPVPGSSASLTPPRCPRGGTHGPAHVPLLRRSGPIPGERARLMSADCFHPNPISWQGFGSPGGLPPLLLPSRGKDLSQFFLIGLIYSAVQM